MILLKATVKCDEYGCSNAVDVDMELTYSNDNYIPRLDIRLHPDGWTNIESHNWTCACPEHKSRLKYY
jgi:hypothetical protein